MIAKRPRNEFKEITQKLYQGQIPKIDFHLHTNWTDGSDTVAQVHQQAIALGLEIILFSEHARSTSGDWFFKFAEEVRSLPSNQCKALVGVETRIKNFAGELDISSEIVEACDMVMASVHRLPGEIGGEPIEESPVKLSQVIDIETRLALAGLENPVVDILGHPFGVSRNRWKLNPTAEDFKQVIAKAAKCGVAVEINSRYHPFPKLMLSWCKDAKALVSLGSNAHSREEIGQIVRDMEKDQTP